VLTRRQNLYKCIKGDNNLMGRCDDTFPSSDRKKTDMYHCFWLLILEKIIIVTCSFVTSLVIIVHNTKTDRVYKNIWSPYIYNVMYVMYNNYDYICIICIYIYIDCIISFTQWNIFIFIKIELYINIYLYIWYTVYIFKIHEN